MADPPDDRIVGGAVSDARRRQAVAAYQQPGSSGPSRAEKRLILARRAVTLRQLQAIIYLQFMLFLLSVRGASHLLDAGLSVRHKAPVTAAT
jgi:hypothetical protein